MQESKLCTFYRAANLSVFYCFSYRNIVAKTDLKSKLLDLAGTAENGSSHEDSLSRTAKIVMAANGLTTPKYVKSPIVPAGESNKKKRPPTVSNRCI
jgi:hypothetical protein